MTNKSKRIILLQGINNNSMDPRPYHFQYRRPRLSNPTYQSSHLYNSIYSFKPENAVKASNPENNRPYDTPPVMKRANSIDLPSRKTVQIQNVGNYRYNSKEVLPKKISSFDLPQPSKLANYGNNLMRNSSMDQTQVYERQQKPFNIISCYPRSYRPNLKQFPRLTLEDRLIETGKEVSRAQ